MEIIACVWVIGRGYTIITTCGIIGYTPAGSRPFSPHKEAGREKGRSYPFVYKEKGAFTRKYERLEEALA
ncbi:MAG: hypothetical protein D6736_20040 [Nitrospinota bacterium]|nr:MAG: hypothetical protein D6736_20040 [Nitrospinota bacterium]